MKRPCLLLFIFIRSGFILYGQDKSNIQRAALGAHFFLDHFKYADSGSTSKYRNPKGGLAISYLTGLTAHFDAIGTLSGSYVNFPIHKSATAGKENQNLLVETDATLRFKLGSTGQIVVPYFQAGLGFSVYSSRYGLYIPAGIGVQVKLFDEAFLLCNTQFRLPVSTSQAEHFYYSIGIAGTIGKVRKKKPAQIVHHLSGPLMSIEDKDSDGDGIVDHEDACPFVKGLKRYKGCPIPDSDGDGIDDEADSCPQTPGLVKYHGCPIPDSDGDGINDEIDQCPTQAGVAGNNGCPVLEADIASTVKLAAKNILFETNSYILLPQSYNGLDSVVRILKDDKNLKLSIEGHTDNIGRPGKNKVLSNNRSVAVKKYLIKSGIDASRFRAIGYGMEKPVADNNTEEGRAKNRRVEFKLFYN